ncbi:MAG: carbohydrate ABC transporter permease [Microvirga sp.]
MSALSARSAWLLTLIALVAVAVTLYPLAWMVQLSLKTQVQALRMPPDFLFLPTLQGYWAAWSKAGFGPALFNSLVVSLMALTVGLVLGGLAAYAVSRYRFVGAQSLLFAMLVTRIFPPVALILPFYLNLKAVGGHDTYWGLALAYVAMNVPLATWMLKGYFDAVPKELEECAMIDGASRFTAVRKVTLPLMAPGIVATAIFAFIVSWNDFLFALILTSRNARTLPVVIAEFVGDTGVDWPEVMAASVTALAPILAATFLLQKHIAQGLTAGAVKG